MHGNLNMVRRLRLFRSFRLTTDSTNASQESIAVDKYGAAKLRNFEFSFQYMRDERPGVMAKVIRSAALVPNPSRWHSPEMFAEVQGFNNNWPIPTRSMDLWATGCLLLAVCFRKCPATRLI